MSTPTIVDPDTLNSLFFDAQEAHKNGRLEEAEKTYSTLLEMFPEAPALLYNLGLVKYELQQFSEGRSLFEKATQHQPDDPDILFNLALCCHKLGDLEGAIHACRASLVLEPHSVDALFNLSCYYRDNHQDEEAISTCTKAVELAPDYFPVVNCLAYLYHRTGQKQQAIAYYEKVLELRPDSPGAQHLLDSLRGNSPDSAPEEYVRDVFDSYSEKFEKSLVEKLEYKVPDKLKLLLMSCLDDGTLFKRGVDLGCGTGLSAMPFLGMVEQIDGVDLSAKMIEQAKQKESYQHLEVGSIITFLKKSDTRYHFFLAADVFNYVGDLQLVFEYAAGCSSDGAFFCFSTERCETEEGSFRLRSTGRFGHSIEYIRQSAETAGWRVIACSETGLRKEKGEWLTGNLWILKRAES